MWETSGHLIESPSRPRCLQHGGGHERGFNVQRKYFPPSVTLYFLSRTQSFPLGWISRQLAILNMDGSEADGDLECLPFIRKFRWKISVKWYCIFWGTESRNGIELYHLQNTEKNFHFLSTWSLTLVIQTNGTENFGRFGKNGKKVLGYLERYYLFPENLHRDEPFHLNSPRNFRVFHTNGKRSLFWYKPSCFIM